MISVFVHSVNPQLDRLPDEGQQATTIWSRTSDMAPSDLPEKVVDLVHPLRCVLDSRDTDLPLAAALRQHGPGSLGRLKVSVLTLLEHRVILSALAVRAPRAPNLVRLQVMTEH